MKFGELNGQFTLLLGEVDGIRRLTCRGVRVLCILESSRIAPNPPLFPCPSRPYLSYSPTWPCARPSLPELEVGDVLVSEAVSEFSLSRSKMRQTYPQKMSKMGKMGVLWQEKASLIGHMQLNLSLARILGWERLFLNIGFDCDLQCRSKVLGHLPKY